MNIPQKVLSNIIFLGAVLLTSSCRTNLPAPDFAPAELHLKALSYNVNWGYSQPRNILAAIRKSDADIVCLQETHSLWQSAVEGVLDQRYPYRKFKHMSVEAVLIRSR